MVFISPSVLNLRKIWLDKKRTNAGLTFIYVKFDVILWDGISSKISEDIDLITIRRSHKKFKESIIPVEPRLFLTRPYQNIRSHNWSALTRLRRPAAGAASWWMVTGLKTVDTRARVTGAGAVEEAGSCVIMGCQASSWWKLIEWIQ